MNAFEDLIGELKEENLLEETVFQNQKVVNDDEFLGAVANETDFLTDTATNESAQKSLEYLKVNLSEPQPSQIPQKTEEITASDKFSSNKLNAEVIKPEELVYPETISPEVLQKANKPEFSEKEFCRRRAIEEVSGLQMVEHVLSGVEREQKKTAPNLHNDIAVKKALHDFLQISEDIKSSEHTQAEFQLMQETENWCSALSHRDKRIFVAHLRRYCETTKPPLSSQALISLARFYRNLPYSESVRSKFDLVVTRLFSKDTGGEKRTLMFNRNDLIKHLTELYGEWSSILVYSTGEEDESQIVLTALKFEEFMAEAEGADSFDELVNNDFFNRLRLLKESTNEAFYAPLITATIIESNIRIGNKYVDLIEKERGKSNIGNLQDKYGFLHDQAISDSTSKTLQLVELLKEKEKVVKDEEIEVPPTDKPAARKISQKSAVIGKKTKTETKPTPVKPVEKTKDEFFTANKWLLIAALLTVLIGFGLYFRSNSSGSKTTGSTNVKKVNLENSSLQQYLQTAQINGDTLEGVTLPSWDVLTPEKKEELLKKIYASGTDKGYVKVQLLNPEGKAVGNATAQKIEVVKP